MSALSQEQSAVAAATESLRQAVLQRDGATLDALAAEELSYGHSNSDIEDKAAYLANFTAETPAFQAIEISEESIVIKESTAIVRHKFIAKDRTGGDVRLHVVLVWVSDGGNWKLLARQAVKLV